MSFKEEKKFKSYEIVITKKLNNWNNTGKKLESHMYPLIRCHTNSFVRHTWESKIASAQQSRHIYIYKAWPAPQWQQIWSYPHQVIMSASIWGDRIVGPLFLYFCNIWGAQMKQTLAQQSECLLPLRCWITVQPARGAFHLLGLDFLQYSSMVAQPAVSCTFIFW